MNRIECIGCIIDQVLEDGGHKKERERERVGGREREWEGEGEGFR